SGTSDPASGVLELSRADVADAPDGKRSPPPAPHGYRIGWARQSREDQETNEAEIHNAIYRRGEVVAGLAASADPDDVAADYGLTPVGGDPALQLVVLRGPPRGLSRLNAAVGADRRLRYVNV